MVYGAKGIGVIGGMALASDFVSIIIWCWDWLSMIRLVEVAAIIP